MVLRSRALAFIFLPHADGADRAPDATPRCDTGYLSSPTIWLASRAIAACVRRRPTAPAAPNDAPAVPTIHLTMALAASSQNQNPRTHPTPNEPITPRPPKLSVCPDYRSPRRFDIYRSLAATAGTLPLTLSKDTFTLLSSPSPLYPSVNYHSSLQHQRKYPSIHSLLPSTPSSLRSRGPRCESVSPPPLGHDHRLIIFPLYCRIFNLRFPCTC